MKNLILEKSGEDAYNYFSQFTDIESNETFVVSTTTVFNILNKHNDKKNYSEAERQLK